MNESQTQRQRTRQINHCQHSSSKQQLFLFLQLYMAVFVFHHINTCPVTPVKAFPIHSLSFLQRTKFWQRTKFVTKRDQASSSWQIDGNEVDDDDDNDDEDVSIRKKQQSQSKSNTNIAIAIEPNLVERARSKLLWETIRSNEAKPVLDLSGLFSERYSVVAEDDRDDSTDDTTISKGDASSSCWEDGSRWIQTRTALAEIGFWDDDGTLAMNTDTDSDINDVMPWGGDELTFSLLSSVPHLLRLETEFVLEAAHTVLDLWTSNDDDDVDDANAKDNDSHSQSQSQGKMKRKAAVMKLLQTTPQLLTYPKDDILYGMEFLTTMMMMMGSTSTTSQASDQSSPMSQSSSLVLQSCLDKPSLFLAAVEGGLQERAVSKALGNAGSAMDGVTKRVVGDAVQSLNVLKGKGLKGKGGGL